MSKKSRKRTPNIPEVTLRRYGVKPSSEAAARGEKAGTGAGFNPDYSHVAKDLRRILVLAVAFIALILLLSLILP